MRGERGLWGLPKAEEILLTSVVVVVGVSTRDAISTLLVGYAAFALLRCLSLGLGYLDEKHIKAWQYQNDRGFSLTPALKKMSEDIEEIKRCLREADARSRKSENGGFQWS